MNQTKNSKAGKWLAQIELLFKACADQTRLRILNMLTCEEEICVCHLVEVLRTNQPKVSRHLAYLKRAGLVLDRKDGLWVYYRLATPLSEPEERILRSLHLCCVEIPEMQRDVVRLQAIVGKQSVVKLPRQVRSAVASSSMIAEEREERSELQVELL
jgi:ArsR family transcriptional regulator, arsenate/arsenite/antimonite-responsive transcriptional repressor